ACVAVAGAAALSLAVSLEPRCLGGPYGVIDPAAWPLWLAHVRENQPLIGLVAETPLTAIAIMAFPALDLLATGLLAREAERRSDFAFLLVGAAFVVAVAMTVAAIRSASYAAWFGMPLVAAFALRLFAALRIEALIARVAVGV